MTALMSDVYEARDVIDMREGIDRRRSALDVGELTMKSSRLGDICGGAFEDEETAANW